MWPGNTVNLRPLGVGERIDAAIKIVRANFLTLAKAALAVAVPSGIVVAVISASIRSSASSVVAAPGTVSTSNLYTLAGGDFLTLVITVVVSAFVTAVCFRIIINAYLGQPAGWREALRFGWSRLGAVLWISFLTYLSVAVVGGVVAALVAICLVASLRALGILLAVVLGIGTVLATIWFLTAARLAVPVMMLENVRGRRAISRSLSLCRGFWWSVFGTQFLAGLLVAIASLAVDVIIRVIFAAFHGATAAVVVEDFISQTIDYAIFAPFSAAILVVLTVDLRVRKEGFDIHLLAERLGLPATESALFFAKPPAVGYPPPGSPQAGWPAAPPAPGNSWPPPPPPGAVPAYPAPSTPDRDQTRAFPPPRESDAVGDRPQGQPAVPSWPRPSPPKQAGSPPLTSLRPAPDPDSAAGPARVPDEPDSAPGSPGQESERAGGEPTSDPPNPE